MFIITGLGNPGEQYSGTRHNVGFMVINLLAKRWQIEINKKKFNSRIGLGSIKDKQVLLQKPATFMNNSGLAVRQALDFYKLAPEDVLIIYDDMALKLGQLRIRTQGSAGGHKGLASVINHLGTEKIPRIRIGIASPPVGQDAIEYVLSRFDEEQQLIINRAIELAANAAEYILEYGYNKAMDKFNVNKQEENL